VRVSSPLNSYLEKQRRDKETKGEWVPELGHVMAKDYAVLARFCEDDDGDDDPLRDYFVAGIRGLGTWGAGWFIDRRFASFQHLDEGDDLQLLLEVHFMESRIVEVIDVSGEPQSYFDRESRSSFIQNRIDKKSFSA
jgi:hypothetical protein